MPEFHNFSSNYNCSSFLLLIFPWRGTKDAFPENKTHAYKIDHPYMHNIYL